MTNFQIARALRVLRPGAQWSLNGDDYSGLVWLDQTQVQPTADDIIAAIAALPPEPVLSNYAALRARMTDAERQTIIEACQSNWQIHDFVLWAAGATAIDLNSADVTTAKAALVAAGVLTHDRGDAIFAAAS